MENQPTNERPPAARGSGRLTRPERLTEPADYKAVFDNRRFFAGEWIVLYAKATDRSFNRMGISVGKRFGNSVARHRFKRLCREAFRLTKIDQPIPFDFVFVPNSRRGKTIEEWKSLSSALVREDFLQCLGSLAKGRKRSENKDVSRKDSPHG